MSVILRYCIISTGSIEENLIGILAVPETTGKYLTDTILGELEKNGLDIQNCRGQGYDSGANMEKEYNINSKYANLDNFLIPASSSSCTSASSSNASELDEQGQAHPGIHKRRIW
ncbi:TTF-type domain-containing protein [Trichonephila clavipes]|nr:TTF-type domain-containing protein [Trichonephila clavipes]